MCSLLAHKLFLYIQFFTTYQTSNFHQCNAAYHKVCQPEECCFFLVIGIILSLPSSWHLMVFSLVCYTIAISLKIVNMVSIFHSICFNNCQQIHTYNSTCYLQSSSTCSLVILLKHLQITILYTELNKAVEFDNFLQVSSAVRHL